MPHQKGVRDFKDAITEKPPPPPKPVLVEVRSCEGEREQETVFRAITVIKALRHPLFDIQTVFETDSAPPSVVTGVGRADLPDAVHGQVPQDVLVVGDF